MNLNFIGSNYMSYPGSSMHEVITGTSYSVPEKKITNNELVDSYNQFIEKYNSENSDCKLQKSDSDFIYKASGINQRFVHDKDGILDINRMHPQVKKRRDEELSLQAEFALKSSQRAIKSANLSRQDIDVIIVSCSNFQRPYPGVAIELQAALGIEKACAFDMNAGCASAVFGISVARSLIRSGMAEKVLVVTPEMYSFHMNFKDRRSHFIFGDGCSAVIVEREDKIKVQQGLYIRSIKLASRYSNNIRNNFGFINIAEDEETLTDDKKFIQNGKNVREEVVPMTIEHINQHLDEAQVGISQIKRLWMHQANRNMLLNIGKGIFHAECSNDSRMPMTIDKYANTAGSSVIGCLNENIDDLNHNDQGIICAFGAGYSVGSILVEKIEV